ncbi:juvenile hormone acid O-methyltransferase-like isoform X2 [Planococcus citri]
MFKAEKYYSYHSLQVRDVITVLQQFKSQIKWTSGQKIIDIGCGPGDVTYELLLPLIPDDAELLAVDMDEKMIDLAKINYSSDARLKFDVADLVKSKDIDKYESCFDTVFSFYCLNWIPEKRLALQNMYSMLKPGGEIVFSLVVDCPNWPLHEILASSPKWSPFMKNYRDSISPYHYSDDPLSEIRNLLQDVGFHIRHSSFTWISYTFPSKPIFHKWLHGINPYLKNIPQCLLKEYEQEVKKTLWDEKLCILNEKGEVVYKYSVIRVFANK